MQSAGVVASTQVADPRAGLGDRCLFLLIAFTPAIFALITWDPAWTEGDASLQGTLRRLSIPVLAIEFATVLFAMTSGLEPIRAIRSIPRWMQAALALLLLIAFGTATLVAPNPPLALFRTCAWLLHLLFGLGMAHLLSARWSELRPHLWPLIVAGTCAYTLIVPFFVVAIQDPRGFDWIHFGLGVVNIRQVGFYTAVGATASLALAATAGRTWRYMAAVGTAALLFALTFWSGSRGSLLAILLSFGAGAAILPALRGMRALWALLASTFVGAALSLLHVPPSSVYGMFRMWGSLEEKGANAISSGRVDLWGGSLRAIMEHPLFGYGESQFRSVVPESLGKFNHPHNLVLQIVVQWGLIGALCFFSLAAILWWHFLVATRRSPSDKAPAFLAANSLLIISLYDGTLYYPYPIMMIAIALAFALNPASPRPPASSATATATARPR